LGIAAAWIWRSGPLGVGASTVGIMRARALGLWNPVRLMRTIASGLDTKNPAATATDTYQLKVLSPSTVAQRVAGVFLQTHLGCPESDDHHYGGSGKCYSRARVGTLEMPDWATTAQILSYVNDAHLIEQKDPTMPTVPGAPVRA
jgi:hypothetical protein